MYNPYGNPDNFTGYKQVKVEYRRNRTSNKIDGTNAINAGGAVIIVIFVALCLTIFGILSFTAAFADKKLADRNLLSIQQYYEADSIAEEKLARIYNAIYAGYVDTKYDNLSLSEHDLDLLDFNVSIPESGENALIVSVAYTTAVNDMQAISSKIKFYASNKRTVSYKVSEWRIIFSRAFNEFQFDTNAINFQEIYES